MESVGMECRWVPVWHLSQPIPEASALASLMAWPSPTATQFQAKVFLNLAMLGPFHWRCCWVQNLRPPMYKAGVSNEYGAGDARIRKAWQDTDFMLVADPSKTKVVFCRLNHHCPQIMSLWAKTDFFCNVHIVTSSKSKSLVRIFICHFSTTRSSQNILHSTIRISYRRDVFDEPGWLLCPC